MNDQQQKEVDNIVKVIESFWGPVIEEIARRTGWSRNEVWSYEILGSIQQMERQINRLAAAYEALVESQHELKPKADKLLDMSLRALEADRDDNWKEGPDGMAT